MIWAEVTAKFGHSWKLIVEVIHLDADGDIQVIHMYA